MIRRAWIAALLVTGCCTPPRPRPPPGQCLTRCGMLAPDTADCARLDAWETAAVEGLGATVEGFSPRGVCRALAGWHVVLMTPTGLDGCAAGWKEGGLCVVGYTRWETRQVALAGPRFSPADLVHEVVHVVDMTETGGTNHCGWKSRGIEAEILRLTGERDAQNELRCPR